MEKSCILILALCLLQFACGGVVRRDAPTEVATKSPITELSNAAEEAVSKFHSAFMDLFGVKTNDELVEMVRVQSRTYANKLQDIASDLTAEAQKHSGVFDDAVKQVKEKISETVAEIESKNPELVADTKKYQEKFEAQLRDVLRETERFSEKLKKEAPEVTNNFSKVANDLYETTAQTAKVFSEKVEDVVKEQKNKL
uniref:Putative apolipophorin-iii n=1 Tax=Phlebotomus kandelakii TaxID=1109342 RepID=A0A6B2E5T7_9DIPT